MKAALSRLMLAATVVLAAPAVASADPNPHFEQVQ